MEPASVERSAWPALPPSAVRPAGGRERRGGREFGRLVGEAEPAAEPAAPAQHDGSDLRVAPPAAGDPGASLDVVA